MIQLIKGTKIDFVSQFKVMVPISVILVLVSLYALFFHMDYGVDFRGGAELQLKFSQPVFVSIDQLRTVLKKGGGGGASVQTIGDIGSHEYLVKTSRR